jgi:rhodanese-related sulfurtransferase
MACGFGSPARWRSEAPLLERARADLDRVEPESLADEVAAGAIMIDIRPVAQRQRDGELPGAIMINRNLLERRLDPTSPDRLPIAVDADICYVIVCTEGYSSSLAAARFASLGCIPRTARPVARLERPRLGPPQGRVLGSGRACGNVAEVQRPPCN